MKVLKLRRSWTTQMLIIPALLMFAKAYGGVEVGNERAIELNNGIELEVPKDMVLKSNDRVVHMEHAKKRTSNVVIVPMEGLADGAERFGSRPDTESDSERFETDTLIGTVSKVQTENDKQLEFVVTVKGTQKGFHLMAVSDLQDNFEPVLLLIKSARLK